MRNEMQQMQSVGNWTRNYEYNNPMNNNYLLGHGGGTVYTYDAHGNMLTMPHLSNMSYDYQDQLISAGNGTFTSYYNYDAEGNRTRKVVVKSNIREERYYIGGYEIYRKYTNDVLDFERKTINISDDEKVFVRIEQKTGENPVIRYQYDNHLGSACLELDQLGAIISYEEYHPFGTTSYRSGRSETEVSLKRYKYCGKERDEETGLYYYGMRYYAAWICRFVSVDPLQFKYPYYTPYQYAGNKPITFIDLDGGEEVKPERLDFSTYREVNTILYDYPLLDDCYSSLIVEGETGQKITLEILTKAFGKEGENFEFNEMNQLIFKGNTDSFTKSENKVFDGLRNIMMSTDKTIILFEKNLLTDTYGGEATKTIVDNPTQTENIIYIDPIGVYKNKTGVYMETLYISKTGSTTTSVPEFAKVDALGRPQKANKYKETPIYEYDSIAARFFHALGHVLYPKNNEQENVIQYDNSARKIFKVLKNGAYKKSKESPRDIDDAHRNKP